MTSPMRAPGLHDNFVLLDGSKRRPLPGVARVTVGLAANIDTQQPAGDSTAVTQTSESTAEITVVLTMWTHAQWMAYQSLLAVFRRGTKSGPAVFTTAHPEVTARRVKRLYFVSEQGEPYNPATGYKVSIKFAEKLKEKANTTPVGSTVAGTDQALGVPSPGIATTPATTALGETIRTSAYTNLGNAPAKTRDGVHTVAEGGYCSSWARVAYGAAGLDTSLFGGTALDTASKFKAAKQYIPWSSAAQGQSQLQVGSLIFFPSPPGAGHVGIYMGKRADGTPMVSGNSYVTYKDRGGLPDAMGRPTGFDKNGKPVDARGIVPLASLGTPIGIGTPYKVSSAPFQGPVKPIEPPKPVPLPTPRPSQNVPLPPAAAFRPAAPSLISQAFNVTPPKPLFP